MSFCTNDTPGGFACFSGVVSDLYTKTTRRVWPSAHARLVQDVSRQVVELRDMSVSAVASMREQASLPGADLETMYEEAQGLCERLHVLLERTSSHISIAALRPLIEDVLSEWDELATDLSISMDSEVHGLVDSLVSALNARASN